MDKVEAIKRIKDHILVHHIGEYPHIKIAEALSMAISALATDTNVGDKVEVVHGCWEVVEPKKFPNKTARIRCSACKKEPKKHTYHDQGHGYSFDVDSWDATDYCPNCGAKMDGDGNG